MNRFDPILDSADLCTRPSHRAADPACKLTSFLVMAGGKEVLARGDVAGG